MRYIFADCVLDTDKCELYRTGEFVKLEPKAYEVLVYLVQHAEHLIPRDELLDHVWPKVYVSHTALAARITAIRKAVRDSPKDQRVIKTLHRQGYRFVAPITVQDTQALASVAPQPPPGAPDPAPPLSIGRWQEEVGAELRPPDEELSHVAEMLEHYCPPPTAVPLRRGSPRAQVVGPVPSVLIQHFKGRIEELRFLREQLTHEHVRLLLVCGRGGVGKTTLITKLLHDLQGDITRHAGDASAEVDGIVYVELRQSEWRSPDKIVERIGQTLAPDAAAALQTKWQEQTSLVDKFEFLFRRTLRMWRCLIVLDNFEDLLDDGNHIREEFGDLRLFIEKCLEWDHSARIVVTSRRTLVLSPELEGRVGMRRAELHLDDGLPESDAVALLRELDHDGGLEIKDASDSMLHQVARRCAGIPHTLKTLVGTLRQRRTWTLGQLLADVAAYARLLDNPARELYASLSPREQLVMQALAVYDRPIPAAAIGALLPGIPVADLLDTLVRNYAVTYDRRRFALHPLDRQYAYGQIPEGDSDYARSALHTCAAAFFHTLWKPQEAWHTIEDLEPQLQEVHHLVQGGLYDRACAVLNAIDADYLALWGHYALIVEMRFPLTHQLTDTTLHEVNWSRLGKLYSHLGLSQQAIECHEQALAAARTRGDRRSESLHLASLGYVYQECGEVQQGIECYEVALAIAREIGDAQAAVYCLGYLGRAYYFLGQPQQAIARHEQTLTLVRDLGDHQEENLTLGRLGQDYLYTGNLPKALEYYQQALAMARARGDRRTEFSQMIMLGRIHRLLGEVRQAVEYLEPALTMVRDTGARKSEGLALGFLGDVYRDVGRVKEAMEHCEQALALYRAIIYHRGEYVRLVQLGHVYQDVGDVQHAMAYYEQALALVGDIGDRLWEGRVLGYMGRAYAASEALPEALGYYERALAILKSIRDREGLSEALLDSGMLHHSLAHLTEARRAYEDALAFDFPTTNYRCAVMLGLLRLEQGDTPGAQDALTQGIALCRALLEKTPQLYRPLYTLALAHLASGHPDTALATYRQAVEVCAAPGVVQGAQHALTLVQRVAPPRAGVAEALALLEQARAKEEKEPGP